MKVRVSDHALLRFLDHAAELNIEELRAHLESSLERAHTAARTVSGSDYLIQADGLLYVVRGAVVTTVINHKDPGASAASLACGQPPRPLAE